MAKKRRLARLVTATATTCLALSAASAFAAVDSSPAISSDFGAEQTSNRFYVKVFGGYAFQDATLKYDLAKPATTGANSTALAVAIAGTTTTNVVLNTGSAATNVNANTAYFPTSSGTATQAPTAAQTYNMKTTQNGWALGAGAGFNINCFSIEGLFGYNMLDGVVGTEYKSGTTATMSMNGMDLMANAYFRFKNSSVVEPFAFAGVGASFNSLELKDNFYTSVGIANANQAPAANTAVNAIQGVGIKISDSGLFSKIDNTTGFKFNVGAGIGLQLSKGIYVDAFYAFSNVGGLEKKDITEKNSVYIDTVPAAGVVTNLTGAGAAGTTSGQVIPTTITKVSVDGFDNWSHKIGIGLRFVL